MQNNIDNRQAWTTEQMVYLSQNLAIAFSLGMADSSLVNNDG
ncbi:hypothetical protein [Leptolyngbya sp. FACHB-541]|nr:hypothetical protein [Leptolyngbya sp. FACHB-541]